MGSNRWGAFDVFTRTPPAGDDLWAVVRDEKCGRFVVAVFFDRDDAEAYVREPSAKALGCFLAPCYMRGEVGAR